MTNSKSRTASTAKKIEQGMDFDVWREAWFDLAREQGHVLQTDPDFGGVNQFVTSGGICNGPGCTKCGWTECMHCDWKGAKIPKCTGAVGDPSHDATPQTVA